MRNERERERKVVRRKGEKRERVALLFLTFGFRNDRRKRRGGFENFWRRPIAPIELVVRDRRCLAGVVQFVATVPIRWTLSEKRSTCQTNSLEIRHRAECGARRAGGSADLSVRTELVD